MLPMSPIREWLMRYRQPGAPSTGGNAQALPMDQPVAGGNQPAMLMQTGGPMPAERMPTKPMMLGGNQPPMGIGARLGMRSAFARGEGVGRMFEPHRAWTRWNQF